MSKCCCSSENCCGQPQPKKPIAIDFLYLDTTVCSRCQDTEKALDEAVSSIVVVLNAAGYEVKVNKENIITRELAIQYRFVSSPTIRGTETISPWNYGNQSARTVGNFAVIPWIAAYGYITESNIHPLRRN